MIVMKQRGSPEIGLQAEEPGAHRKRGRPKKLNSGFEIDPGVLKDAVRKVKAISKEYANGDLQADVRYYQTHRPRLLKNAEVREDAVNGQITYNAERVATMTADDQKTIHRYITSQEEIIFLRQAVACISEIQMREVAIDTILKGSNVLVLPGKYGVTASTIWRWKKSVLEYIAGQYLKWMQD